jgi:hypothetical protein
VKFVVIASDVVYPVGAMKDYEPNFYLPLMGVDKPCWRFPATTTGSTRSTASRPT